MNSKNENKLYRRLNIQVCELLPVLTEAAIERAYSKMLVPKLFFWIKE